MKTIAIEFQKHRKNGMYYELQNSRYNAILTAFPEQANDNISMKVMWHRGKKKELKSTLINRTTGINTDFIVKPIYLN